MFERYLIRDVHESSRRSLFTVVSTFAGGGGSSIGYGLAGGRVLLASEFVAEAVRTYASNFPETVIDPRDIRKVTSMSCGGVPVGILDLLDRCGLKPGDLDILDGSPPCTEFSRAGNGLSDPWVLKKHSDNYQKRSGYLFYDFVKLAKRALPKVFVIENVPEMATNKKCRWLFDGFVDAARFFRLKGKPTKRAYYVYWKVLTSSDFGVPQKRRRMYMIGIRKDVAEAVGITSDDRVADVFPIGNEPLLTVRDAFASLDQSEEERNIWKRAMMVSSQYDDVSMLPKSPERIVGLSVVGIKDRNWNLKRSSWDHPCPTLTSSGQKPRGGLGGIIHPIENRKFTISELRRLFGLPDDYRVTGTLDQAAERIGNMVTPFVSQAIGESIYEHVLTPYRQQVVTDIAA